MSGFFFISFIVVCDYLLRFINNNNNYNKSEVGSRRRRQSKQNVFIRKKLKTAT